MPTPPLSRSSLSAGLSAPCRLASRLAASSRGAVAAVAASGMRYVTAADMAHVLAPPPLTPEQDRALAACLAAASREVDARARERCATLAASARIGAR